MSTLTIQLSHLRFAAPHGVFAEEALTGNDFEVNLTLTVKAPKEVVTSLEETINYGEVFSLVKSGFAQKRELLETIAMEIAASLKERFPSLVKISVQVVKHTPPIVSFAGAVSVTYNRKYRNGKGG